MSNKDTTESEKSDKSDKSDKQKNIIKPFFGLVTKSNLLI